jgi:CelD/BcsL family acetyltransferase involved in cellulose biosynthesis
MGPLAFDILRPTPGELKPLLDEAMRIEAASWKGRVGTALASDPVREAFYRGYAAAACTKGTLHISFLRIGPQAAAMEIAVESGNRFWLLRIGYDEAFATCSPGALLMLETVRYAAARGLHSYEFLGTSESWTRMWTQLERPCVSLRAYPTNLRGMLVFAADIGTVARQRFGRVFGRTA